MAGMEKRKPLSLMIALGAPKGRGKDREEGDDRGDEEGEHEDDDETRGKYTDPGLVKAAEDMIDAMAKRDPEELSVALGRWMEICESLGHGDY